MRTFLILIILLCLKTSAQYFYNQWAVFDGVNDYLAAPDNSDLLLDTAFTIEGWIFVRDTTGTNKTILSRVNNSLNEGYALLVQGSSSNPGHAGKLQLNLNGGSYVFPQTASTRLAFNNWSHFAVTFKNSFPNNDTIRFYINGTLIQNFYSNIPSLVNSADSLRIGNCYIPGNFGNGFYGMLDNIRIYKSAKIASVIANNRGIPLGMELTTDIGWLSRAVFFSALSASWNFDANGNDRVGNFNDLMALNGAHYNGNNFNPDNYRLQTNYYMRFPGTSWLAGPDGSNSIFDLDTAGTLEAWVYIDAYRAAPQTIISKGSSSYSYILSVSSSPASAPVLFLNSGAKFLQSSKKILPKVWTHIAATYRASTGEIKMYINGVFDTSRVTSPGNINVSNDSLFVGRSVFGEYMYGEIDAVKISRYVKTQQEISNLMHTSVDFSNVQGNSLLQSSYNFEGNTLNNISNLNYLIPRNNVYFERLNVTSGPGGRAQAPLLRTSYSDAGFNANSFRLSQNFINVRNGTTVRDSILVSGISGTNRVTAVVLMNHTNAADVTLNLRAPNGTSVNLIQARGGTNNDIMTVFDDFADSIASNALVPFSMRVRPIVPLSGLPQTNQNGYWRLTVTDNASPADSGRVYLWGIKFISTVGVVSGNESPGSYELFQNYPNPFNPTTIFGFQIAKSGFVSLKIYDILGRECAVLINEELNRGTYEVEWNAENYPSGIYFYRLKSGLFSKTLKMALIK